MSAARCGGSTKTETPAESTPAADAAHTGDHAAIKRVFFVSPKDGDTVKPDAKPGMHKLTVQAGDDKHTTIEGLCQTITVNVAG